MDELQKCLTINCNHTSLIWLTMCLKTKVGQLYCANCGTEKFAQFTGDAFGDTFFLYFIGDELNNGCVFPKFQAKGAFVHISG